jgi:hypothetical protein
VMSLPSSTAKTGLDIASRTIIFGSNSRLIAPVPPS